MVGAVADAALAYGRHRWHVLPLHSICPDGSCTCGVANCGSAGKHPRTAHGLKDATDNPATLEEWWRRWPLANVGIATGAASGIDALDIDLRHQGDETLAAFERANGTLPATVMSHTGGGGLHLLFTHTEGIGNSAGKLGRGVDVRGDGGYIVAPPSLHRSGRPYAWDVDHHPDDIAPAALPAWLIAQLVPPKEAGSGTATDPMEWAELIANTAEQGFRNTTATRLVGYLLAHRIDPYVALEIMRLWAARCHPPLGDEELCRIIASICRREELKRKEDQFHV